MRRIDQSSHPEVWNGFCWVETHMEQIDPEDIFRIRKPDGTLHEDAKGQSEWECIEVPTIACKALKG